MKTATMERPLGTGGIQRVYRFANGFGASVVRFAYSYGGPEGLWELAVIRFTGPKDDDYELTYDTPITSDVEGRLTEDDVDALLAKIEKLPSSYSDGCAGFVPVFFTMEAAENYAGNRVKVIEVRYSRKRNRT